MRTFNLNLLIISIFLTTNLAFGSHQITSFKLSKDLESYSNYLDKNITKRSVSAKTLNSPSYIPINIFDQIMDFIGPNYQTIGEAQTGTILNHNESFDLGQSNYNGFVWQKPMGNFKIAINRQLSPDLFDDVRWIIYDTFTIYINAYTYLHNLKESGAINISNTTLAAYAGIEFVRIYKYVHFSNSFEEGLTKEYNKLFLSFQIFQKGDYSSLEPYEFISKKDFLNTAVGAAGKIPVYKGLNIEFGVLSQKETLSETTLQYVGPKDGQTTDEVLRVSYKKQIAKQTIEQVNLEADFLKLLKITLLSYEHSTQESFSSKVYLSFFKKDIKDLANKTPISNALKNLLSKGEINDKFFSNYKISEDTRIKENKSSRYQALLWGNKKSSETEQIKIEKDGVITTFFKNRFENVKYVKSIIGTLWDSFFRKYFNIMSSSIYKTARIRKIILEYRWQDEKLAETKNVYLQDEGKLSFNIENKFYINQKTNNSNDKYMKYALYFAKNYTNLKPRIIEKIESHKLTGPLSISSKTQINKRAIKYFNSQSPTDINRHISKTCKFNISKYNRLKRKRNSKNFFTKFQSTLALMFLKKKKSYKCYDKISDHYQKYYKNYGQYKDISLDDLKNFINYYVKYSDSKQDLINLFGMENLFFNGSFRARTDNNFNYLTYFSEGTFDGLGIIDNFNRENELVRAPASVPVQ